MESSDFDRTFLVIRVIKPHNKGETASTPHPPPARFAADTRDPIFGLGHYWGRVWYGSARIK